MISLEFYFEKINEAINEANEIKDNKKRRERKFEILRSMGRAQDKLSGFLEELKNGES